MKKLSTEEFISKSMLIHDYTYDYSKVYYINSHRKIEIICKQHGSFFQRPYDHLNKKGCSVCSKNMLKTTEQFIIESKIVHNDIYDYSNTKYTGNKNKVEIICKQHGSFFQIPNNHLSGAGCIRCKGLERKNKNIFIEQSNKIHNNFFDYSRAEYINSHTKIEIICPKHGSFWQTPAHHVISKSGCSKCKSFSSKIENEWLDQIGIPNDRNHRQVFIKINNKKYRVDGYDPEHKIIYEFLGDYWHGNLSRFDEKKIHPILKKTYFTLYNEWIERKKTFENNGYSVIFIWEYDFRKGLNT